MCGSITYFNGSGSYTERYIAREDFLKNLTDAIDCGETITYKVISNDKAFRKQIRKAINDAYGMSKE